MSGKSERQTMSASEGHVESLARVFRSAMDAADRSSWGIEFSHFPKGACGDTSLMLGEFLFERGCGSFDYISGFCGSGTHAWIEKSDLILDITGDQFSDFGQRVYVSRDRTWHSRYEVNAPIRARLDVFGPGVQYQLRRIYNSVKALIR